MKNIFDMKHISIFRVVPLLALAWGLWTLPACTDDWDNHYDKSSFDLPKVTLTEYIKSQSNLSIFSQILHATGYDTIIAATQSFTVWAPTNEALVGVDLNDRDLMLEIVKNHVARSTYSTAGVINKPIYMLNNKFVAFTKAGPTYAFGKVDLVNSNIPLKNGVLHVINGYAPYVKNIWEYISRTQGLDSLKKYIDSKNIKTFDPTRSTIISYKDGEPVYDSVFIDSNVVFETIGLLNSEDSTYTAILPNNDAWVDGYAKVKPFFNFRTQDGGPARQHDYTKLFLVKDLVFSGKVENASSLDSLVSTTRQVLYNPAYLFNNTQQVELSNGLGYVASTHNHIDTASWYKPIKVEAESSNGREPSNCVIINKTAYGLGHKISNNRYIEAQFTSGLSSFVSFTIPFNLSAKYNIYCVFAPSNIENPSDIKPVKTRFQLQLVRTGTTTAVANQNFPAKAEYVTDPFNVTKMFVGTYTFANANITDEDYGTNFVTTKFRVYNDGINNSALYNLNMRIDCIIFEPVK